jgi:hypothetical protein
MPNMLNVPRSLLLQSSKIDNNARALTQFITSNLEKHNLIQQAKLSTKFPRPPIMSK